MKEKTIYELKGKTLISIERGDQEIVISCLDGSRYRMYHEQDCCESVVVDDIEGDPCDVLDSPIIDAQENIGHSENEAQCESVTLTDFVLVTEKGRITIKWIGESNGYYSESVYFVEIDPPDKDKKQKQKRPEPVPEIGAEEEI